MFDFDVFISYSRKDQESVTKIAERLKADGLKVWFDHWEIQPGDHIPHKIEQALEASRVLLLCVSAAALASDWSQLEAYTFRFRDPLNKDRRFIPLRLDDARPPGGLAAFYALDWRDSAAYPALLEACRPPAAEMPAREHLSPRAVKALCAAFSPDLTFALTGDFDGPMRLWDVRSGRVRRVLRDHYHDVWALAWSPDGRFAVSGDKDGVLRLWDVKAATCLKEIGAEDNPVNSLLWTPDQTQIISGTEDGFIRVWAVSTGELLQTFNDSPDGIYGLALSADGQYLVSGSRDFTISVWDVASGERLRILEGHTGELRVIVLSSDQRHVLSGAEDGNIRLWQTETGECLRVFDGHKDFVWSLAWRSDQRFFLSGSLDGTVRVWDTITGDCVQNLDTGGDVRLVAWSLDERSALACDIQGKFYTWDLADLIDAPGDRATLPDTALPTTQYTNAKVLLVGDSGAGKTGLSRVLAGEAWQPSDSTIGAWATQWNLPTGDMGAREIWLWDFGGQADQRLIHQLYFDQTALAVLVFDGQKDNLLDALEQWNRDLTRVANPNLAKLLVAARVDAGGIRGSRQPLEKFRTERGFAGLFETSAKEGQGCEALGKAIADTINWDSIPWRSSPLIFKTLKNEILRLKNEGRVLMRINELRDALRLRLASIGTLFRDEDLTAVIRLLSGPGVVWDLNFGGWLLFKPELINAYAQAVIRTMREDEHERGCLAVARILGSDLSFSSSLERLEADEEYITLFAMQKTLIDRNLCLIEQTEQGDLMVFPSYHRRERPEQIEHPAVLVSYKFRGFLDEIYATLVVKLHHTRSFKQDQLWRYAADFRTLTGKQLGIRLITHAEGIGELQIYFDPQIPNEEKIIFSQYIHDHISRNADNIERLRHYVCQRCGTPVGNRDVAMQRLKEGFKDIACIRCDSAEHRVPLWDEIEELFTSDTIKFQVKNLQAKSFISLDNESKERILVGDIISTVALAGQLSREVTVSDHGIDMEIEFKTDKGEATGRKIYLQLKSGDSHLKRRKDGAETFNIKQKRHTTYWRNQPFPVMLIIRTADGNIRWMDVRRYLQQFSDEECMNIASIPFSGERFDVTSILGWRQRALETELL